uniref:Uncharacterized protein n=1 Tax=Lactuca sativa TaxID=4236 RepID=A0A9R1WWQ3_LACSA|nr:hypothetical protein LSAT_V11C800421250 [Lactuca sativa]
MVLILTLFKHPNKNYVANKPFPAYERLANVFDKDRATGGMAESADDVIENQNIDNEEGESFPLSNSTPQNTATSSNPNPKDLARNKKRKAAYEEVTHFTKNLNLLPMWNSLDTTTKPLFAKAILEDDN